MTQYISDKIKILSAVSIILVLYIHSGFHADEIAGMAINDNVQEFISGMIGRCAVPLFFMISGYLFFLKVPNGLHSIFEKIKKRIRTLLVPYIIACVFFVLFYVILDVTPGVGRFMNSDLSILFEKKWVSILYEVFYRTENGLPVAFHLWFLRDLMILVLVSPLLYYLLKYLKWAWILIAFVLMFFVPKEFFSVHALFWFCLGAYLTGVKSKKVNNVRVEKVVILTLLFLTLCLIELFFVDFMVWQYIKIPIILLGIASLWLLYDKIIPATFLLNRHLWIKTICNFTFFIYLFHEPTLNVVRKLIVFVIGKNAAGYLISYLFSPFIFMIAAVIVGIILKKYLPKFYEISVGGR